MVAVAEREREAGRIGLAYQATEPYFHAPWMHGFDGALLDDPDAPAPPGGDEPESDEE